MAYLIWTGCYSDKGVVGVFTHKEHAEEMIKLCPQLNEPYLEEIEIDNITTYRNRKLYELRLNKNGDLIEKPEIETHFYRKNGHGIDRHGNLFVMVWAESSEHAIKYAQDLRVQLIANNEWK